MSFSNELQGVNSPRKFLQNFEPSLNDSPDWTQQSLPKTDIKEAKDQDKAHTVSDIAFSVFDLPMDLFDKYIISELDSYTIRALRLTNKKAQQFIGLEKVLKVDLLTDQVWNKAFERYRVCKDKNEIELKEKLIRTFFQNASPKQQKNFWSIIGSYFPNDVFNKNNIIEFLSKSISTQFASFLPHMA